MLVRCSRSNASELCKGCPHNGVHEEILYPGVKMLHSLRQVCSEGGTVRCIAVQPSEQGRLFR